MPYKSKKQSAFMHSQHPDIAARWDAEMKTKGEHIPTKTHKSKVKSAASKALGGKY